MKKDNTIYIRHILESIKDMENSVKNISKENFGMEKDVRDANIRRLEVIGEATKNISDDFKKKYPKIEWKKIAGARDILIHAYFSVDIDLIWDIIKKDLPKLKEEIEKILEKEK